MDNILYQFSGHNKIAIPIIYHDNYDWQVNVYDDHLVINRSGKLREGLQTKTTIYFQDVTDIQYYSELGFTWIIFSMPGINQSSPIYTTANVTKNFSFTSASSAGETIPYSNTYAICNYSDKSHTLRAHFDAVSKIFDEYRAKNKKTSGTTVMQVHESAIDKLKKLKDLKDLGIITISEYEEKRTKLLNEI